MSGSLSSIARRVLVSLAAVLVLTGCVGEPTSEEVDTTAPDLGDTTAGEDAAPDTEPVETLSCADDTALELYEQRIAPLMASDRVDSCNTCHLSGVELRNYVRDTPCQTMACMEQLDIVDLDAPQDSLVLDWITRGEPDSGLITSEVVRLEHDAFKAWIEYSARCQDTVCSDELAGVDDPCGGRTELVEPDASAEVLLAGCDAETLVAAFDEKIMAWEGRCSHCHSTAYELPEALRELQPQWMAPPDHPDAARRTMLNLLALGAVDVERPDRSRLLTKPLAVAWFGEEHGGGDKIESPEEPAYTDFLSWLELYARCATSTSPEPPDAP